jgi:hypothetical protein
MTLLQDLRPGQTSTATQASPVGSEPSAPAQTVVDIHPNDGGRTLDGVHDPADFQTCIDAAVPPPEPKGGSSTNWTPARADALLLLYADALDDLERVRIATENRARSLAQVKGMDGTPEQARLDGLTSGLAALEHDAELQLKRALRQHPLGPWVKRVVGIGEKQGARLLAAIGDPAERRTVSQLWAYCGYHVLHPDHHAVDTHAEIVGVDPSGGPSQSATDAQTAHAGVAPSRRKGQRANWNSTAKMRAFLCAESCVKQAKSPYRAVYDAGRAKYADAIHAHPCARCGPSGKPAEIGSPLSAGHQHARALRLVAKAILRDLWVEARRDA